MASKSRCAGERIPLRELCSKGKSSLRLKDLPEEGAYEVYGASGVVGTMDSYQIDIPYVALVKDGAGVGRAMSCEAKTSVLGTMQALLPKDGVERDYLLHLVRSMKLDEGFSGSTIPHIYFKDYGKRLVPDYGAKEQALISENLTRIEQLQTFLERQIGLFDLLVKSRFVEMFGDPTGESDCPRTTLGSLYNVRSSKRIYAREQTKSGVPFYRLADIGIMIDGGVPESGLYISEEKYAELSRNGQVPGADDILVTARGTLGRCYTISERDRFYFQDGMITWLERTDCSPLSVYAAHVFQNDKFLDALNRDCGGTTVKYLSISDLSEVAIPVPPISLQQEFTNFVVQVDKSRFAVQQQIEKLQMLYDSLAQDYFG